MMNKRVGVIGVGTAGLLSLMHMCVWLDKSWQVVSIHDPRRKILGIGESTNGGFVNALEQATNFSIAHADEMAALGATLKFGSRFQGWRKQEWINPLLNGNIAVHFDSRLLQDFVLSRLPRLWPAQFRTLLGEVQAVRDGAEQATLTVDGIEHDFDFLIDCRGTPEDFSDYTFSDCTLINRCLVHQAKNYEFAPYTDHIATQNGWMFGVPLQGHKTYGYLYNDEITNPAAARADLEQILGIRDVNSGHYDREFVLRPYSANELVHGRVCKNGNRALFFEPLIANSIFLYLRANRLIFDYMINGAPAPDVNAAFRRSVGEMEDVISYYYQGGSLHRSEFWRAATAAAQTRLSSRTEFLTYLGELQRLKGEGLLHAAPGYGWSAHTWQIVDAQLGYHYVDPDPGSSPRVPGHFC